VPILVEAKLEAPARELHRLRSNVLNLFLAGGVALAAAVCAASAPLIGALAPGLSPDLRPLASELLRVCSFSIPMAFAGGALVSFHYAEERYYRPTLAPCAGVVASLVLLVTLQARLGVRVLAWGMVLSALVQAALLTGILEGHSWRLGWGDQRLRKLARRMLPLCGGNVYYKSDPLVDRFLLSYLPVGSISYLGYGQRALTGIGQVLARGLVTTRFGELSALHYRDPGGFRSNANRLFVQACLLSAPLIVCLLLFTEPLLRLLLERGAFTALDVTHTATASIALFGLLAGGLVGSALNGALYAMGDTRAVTLIGIVAYTLGIALKIAGVFLLSYVGVALATSAYFLVAVGLEAALLQRRARPFSWRGTGLPLLKALGAASVAAGAALAFREALGAGPVPLAGGLLVVLAVYLALSLVLGTVSRHQLHRLLAWLPRGGRP
jgi:putative peptidoglycan lipid II flippase